MAKPLTEKYRPRSLDEVTGNREVLACLKTFKMADLPNMLFYGPPGTGKTTAIRAMLADHPPRNVLEMNASDDRGIDVVREQIKVFAQSRTDLVKVVVLDEADSMSRDAQNALRRVMEDYENTRFCLICNFSKKIIDPIVSRCAKFRFSPVNEESRIREVCLKEGIAFDDEGVSILNEHSDGDMRKVMNDIQGISSSYPAINRESVLEFFGLCDSKTFRSIFECLMDSSLESCQDRISREGLDCGELINGIVDLVVGSEMKNKLKICKDLADIEQRLAAGCSESVQMNAIISTFILNRRD